MRLHRTSRREAGFTLIEVLIVVAIIAILAAILIPNLLRARQQSAVAATKANIHNIATVLEQYYADYEGYPAASPGLSSLAPTYTKVIPSRPDGGSYGYKTDDATPPQDFVVCDNMTDTITDVPEITTWYWLPHFGMLSVVGPSVDVGFATCP